MIQCLAREDRLGPGMNGLDVCGIGRSYFMSASVRRDRRFTGKNRANGAGFACGFLGKDSRSGFGRVRCCFAGYVETMERKFSLLFTLPARAAMVRVLSRTVTWTVLPIHGLLPVVLPTRAGTFSTATL